MMRTRKAVLITTVCVMALCMSACSSNETDAAPVTETPSAEPAESTEPQLAETPSEEEQIDIIYKNALDSTVCIFTPTGNNGTGFLYNEHYVITNAHVLYEAEVLPCRIQRTMSIREPLSSRMKRMTLRSFGRMIFRELLSSSEIPMKYRREICLF